MTERNEFRTEAGAQASASSALKTRDEPALTYVLWPNRSLSQEGFRLFLWITAIGLAIPLLPLLGSKVGSFLIPFMAGTFCLTYCALKRSFYDGRMTEEFNLWPDLVTVTQRDPFGRVRRWDANPFWVRLQLYKDAKIENYLTLRGNGREIEIGAFLSPEERLDLYGEIGEAFRKVKNGTLTPTA